MRSLGRTARGVPLHGKSPTPSLLVLDDYLRISAKHFEHLQPPTLQVEVSDTYIPQRTAEEKGSLVEKLYPYDIISTMRERTPFPGELLHQLPNLKLLLCTGTQFETFDLETAKDLGITVASALGRGRSDETQHKQDIRKGGSHPATHHTWAMILALARNIAADDASIKAGGWQSDMAVGLSGKTLGVVGLGRLGAAVARIGSLAFGMKIKCWSSSLGQAKADEMAVKLGLPIVDEDGDKTFGAVSKEELFATADVVTLHYVLSERSRGIVSAKELAVMKKSALLVNTSRGALIDEAALLDAANEGSIRGVALDVFESEPLPADSPWRSQEWGKGKKSRVLVTPHMGYVEEGIMNNWYAEQAENVERWLDGKDVLHQLV
ncbi:2-hydroxyacid dehydrogenase [Fusarium tjaetaba]|uniref:2-hydroxyacid dehydrogenase n=1 Tax=Fusarium tjaetaba TaxID=1567544 RepID=A0A8H5VRW1_9HYPO|nr:2-hydroxyacid dehydrogenase [Fusarium tjaetaba]KAF5632253.1 2-hydroxyacid dehydrogenase [Fusarium tjaetaba]